MNDITARAPQDPPAEMEAFTGFVSFNGCRIQVDFVVPAGASAQQVDSAFVEALRQEAEVDVAYLSVGATRLEPGTTLRLQSSSEVNAPGLFRYLQNAYESGDARVAIQALAATYEYVDQVLAEALLSERVAVRIEGEAVCFEMPPAQVLDDMRRHSKLAWSRSDTVLASRFFVRCVLGDGTKVLLPTTAHRIRNAFALETREHQALTECFYCDEEDGQLYPIELGHRESTDPDPDKAGEGPVILAGFDLLANGKVIGQIPCTHCAQTPTRH
jgi:hypothetical protein